VKTILIIGGTSAIAMAATKYWLQREAARIILVGRNKERLVRVQKDLKLRYPRSSIEIAEFDISSETKILSLAQQIMNQYLPNIVFIAHGLLASQGTSQQSLELTADVLRINGTSVVLWMEAASSHFELKGQGSLVVIGSVAGDRARQSNYTYGASKALVASYAEGLQHRFANSEVKVILVKPGPTDSPMTEHLKASGMKLAKLETVGKHIVNGIDRGMHVIYTPKIWGLIMFIIRHLPKFIMHRTQL
jgi:hypothetical protein